MNAIAEFFRSTFVARIFTPAAKSARVSVVSVVLVGCVTAGGILVNVPSGSGLNICADFEAAFNCEGLDYYFVRSSGDVVTSHHGIDFAASPGTEVISSTQGTVNSISWYDCGGGVVKVETDLKEVHPILGVPVPIYAWYFHIVPNKKLKAWTNIKPGDVVGYVDRASNISSCAGSTDHVHFELRLANNWAWYLNPHKYWADGPGKVTCYRKDLKVPSGKAVAPLRCKSTHRRPQTS